ncbi:MAG: ComF family protein, partial [Spirochaetales bacterium]|nr:ComF family protein [Spirochaetales bacterium]
MICDECKAALDGECFDSFMSRCPVCFYPKVAPFYECDKCAALSYNKVYPVARYDGPLSYSILDSFKFHAHKEMAHVIALYLSRALSALDPQGNALIVPIPCSNTRLKKSGWDPMVEVAKALRRPYLQILSNSDLQRIQQKRLNRQQRLSASEGRFVINPDYSGKLDEIKDKSIIVIDDIVTTMSTMNSAISFLRENG